MPHVCDGDDACDSYEMGRIVLVRVALCAMEDCGRIATHEPCGASAANSLGQDIPAKVH